MNIFLKIFKNCPSVGSVFIEEADGPSKDVPAESALPVGKRKHLYVIRALKNSTIARKDYLYVSFQTQKV